MWLRRAGTTQHFPCKHHQICWIYREWGNLEDVQNTSERMKKLQIAIATMLTLELVQLAQPVKADVSNFIGLCLQEANCELAGFESAGERSTVRVISTTDLAEQLRYACESGRTVRESYYQGSLISYDSYFGTYSVLESFGGTETTLAEGVDVAVIEDPPLYSAQACFDEIDGMSR
jgi:hypothetical protein